MGVIVAALGVFALLAPVGALIGYDVNQTYSRAAMIVDLAIGASLVSAGVAIWVRPRLGYRILFIILIVLFMLFCLLSIRLHRTQ
jgi:uncharacterized membrane protein (UPF0136 family)